MSPITDHLVSPPPAIRESKNTDYAHGVITGSILIDMATYLSRSNMPIAWAHSYWLQEHYIDPSVRIERLDGIVVKTEEHMVIIRRSHWIYSDLRPMPQGSGLPPQVLWVPGLEPMYFGGGFEVIGPGLPMGFVQEGLFDGALMYMRKGDRKGTFLEAIRDLNGWEREVWALPDDGDGEMVPVEMICLPRGEAKRMAWLLEEEETEGEDWDDSTDVVSGLGDNDGGQIAKVDEQEIEGLGSEGLTTESSESENVESNGSDDAVLSSPTQFYQRGKFDKSEVDEDISPDRTITSVPSDLEDDSG